MTIHDFDFLQWKDGADDVNVGQYILFADPMLAPGWVAEPGSIAQRNDGLGVGQLFLKNGPLDTDWIELGDVKDTRGYDAVVGNALAGDTVNDCDYLDPGDGTGILQALIDGYRHISIRRGTYTLVATIDVTSAHHFYGQTSTVIVPPPGQPAFRVNPIVAQGTADNVQFHNLIFQLVGGNDIGIQFLAMGSNLVKGCGFVGNNSPGQYGINTQFSDVMGGGERGLLRIEGSLFFNLWTGVFDNTPGPLLAMTGIWITSCHFAEFSFAGVDLGANKPGTVYIGSSRFYSEQGAVQAGIFSQADAGLVLDVVQIFLPTSGRGVWVAPASGGRIMMVNIGRVVINSVMEALRFETATFNCTIFDVVAYTMSADTVYIGPHMSGCWLTIFRDSMLSGPLADDGFSSLRVNTNFAGSVIDGCQIWGHSHSIYLDSFVAAQIMNGGFGQNYAAPIRIGQTDGGQIDSVYIGNSGGMVNPATPGIQVDGFAARPTFTNIRVIMCSGILFGGTAAQGHISQLSMNVGMGGVNDGIQFADDVQQFVIENCLFNRCTTGIRILSPTAIEDMTIANNVFAYGTDGILASRLMERCTVTHNHFIGMGAYGVQIQDITRCIFDGNTFDGSVGSVPLIGGWAVGANPVRNLIAHNMGVVAADIVIQFPAGSTGNRALYNAGTVTDAGANTLVGNGW